MSELRLGICKRCGRILTMGNEVCNQCNFPLSETNYTWDEYKSLWKDGINGTEDIDKILRERYVLNSNNKDLDEDLYYKREDKELLEKMQFNKKIEEICEKHRAPSPKSNTCPKCGGTNWTPVRRKWSIVTGFMTNKVDMVCSNCGYTKKG